MPSSQTRDKRRRRRWSITTSKLSEATGLTARTVRKHINAGTVDPLDLYSVAVYVIERAKRREFTLPPPQPPVVVKKAKEQIKKVKGVYM